MGNFFNTLVGGLRGGLAAAENVRKQKQDDEERKWLQENRVSQEEERRSRNQDRIDDNKRLDASLAATSAEHAATAARQRVENASKGIVNANTIEKPKVWAADWKPRYQDLGDGMVQDRTVTAPYIAAQDAVKQQRERRGVLDTGHAGEMTSDEAEALSRNPGAFKGHLDHEAKMEEIHQRTLDRPAPQAPADQLTRDAEGNAVIFNPRTHQITKAVGPDGKGFKKDLTPEERKTQTMDAAVKGQEKELQAAVNTIREIGSSPNFVSIAGQLSHNNLIKGAMGRVDPSAQRYVAAARTLGRLRSAAAGRGIQLIDAETQNILRNPDLLEGTIHDLQDALTRSGTNGSGDMNADEVAAKWIREHRKQ